MSELSARHKVYPKVISTWKKRLIEGAPEIFSRGMSICISIFACLSMYVYAGPGDGKGPYPGFEDLYRSACKAVGSRKLKSRTVKAVDTSLKNSLEKGADNNTLASLLCLRRAVQLFSGTSNRDMARYLLDRPAKCGRFIHAVDQRDDVNKALDILSALRKIDKDHFETWFEFCVAYSVVWDKFRGHWWVDRRMKMEKNTMENTYSFYIKHERSLKLNPSNLPFELAVFVVGTRLTAKEREWIIRNYNRGSIHPGNVYRSVPWTQKLSPAHGKGGNTPYTLQNIRKLGGVCMEQAYFTENVLRIFGVPAVYTRGRGQRGGHAWAGALMVGSRTFTWDFSFGRYRYDHYFKVEVRDPTDMRSTLTDSAVKMTSAAMMKAGSIRKLEHSYYSLDAALWAQDHLAEKPDSGKTRKETVRDLLVASLRSNPYNGRTWMHLSRLAAKKKMDTKTGIFWVNKLLNITVREFPDFTVECLDNFLACVDDMSFKANILKKIYNILRKDRADLASDIKLQEGDLWMQQGQTAQALLAYAYPLVNFSKDAHVLDRAKKRINEIDRNVNPEKLEQGYVTVINSIRRMRNKSKEAREIEKFIIKRLVSLYEKKNDKRKAQYYRSLMGK